MRVNTPSFDQATYDEASDEDKIKLLVEKVWSGINMETGKATGTY